MALQRQCFDAENPIMTILSTLNKGVLYLTNATCLERPDCKGGKPVNLQKIQLSLDTKERVQA